MDTAMDLSRRHDEEMNENLPEKTEEGVSSEGAVSSKKKFLPYVVHNADDHTISLDEFNNPPLFPPPRLSSAAKAVLDEAVNRFRVGSTEVTPPLFTTGMFLDSPPSRDGIVPGNPLYRCSRCHRQHLSPVDVAREISRVLRSRRQEVQQRADVAETVGTEAVESVVLLKSLLKGVLRGFRNLDGGDSRSVIEHKQSIEKLRRSGFNQEYKLLRMLHTEKLDSQKRGGPDEISKLLEKFHL